MKEFVSALAEVRKTHDLLFDSNGGVTALFGKRLEATVSTEARGSTSKIAHPSRR
jgi:hypothetical protein